MAKQSIPDTIRPLFDIEQGEPVIPADKPEIVDRKAEAKRVMKRILAIIEDHRQACLGMGVELGTAELRIVLAGLRDHAKGGDGALDLADRDEIQSYGLTRLFEELVEEPSNILYVTRTSADTERYDAMDSAFWGECLDLIETTIS